MKIKSFQMRITVYLLCTIFLSLTMMFHITHGEYFKAACDLIGTLLVAGVTGSIHHDLKKHLRSIPKSTVLPELRRQKIFRLFANHLLRLVGIPTRIPAGAINALWGGFNYQTKDGSPLDWPVYWVQLEGHPTTWIWRHIYEPTGTIPDSDGKWRQLKLPDP